VIKLQRLYLGIDVDRADGTIGAVGANGCDERENGVSNRQIPSVTLLHHPAIVEVLLRSLFNPSKKLRGDALEAHAFVLSVAVRGVDASTSAGADADTVSFAEHPRVKELIRIIRIAVSLGYKATEDTVLTAEERAQVDESMAEVGGVHQPEDALGKHVRVGRGGNLQEAQDERPRHLGVCVPGPSHGPTQNVLHEIRLAQLDQHADQGDHDVRPGGRVAGRMHGVLDQRQDVGPHSRLLFDDAKEQGQERRLFVHVICRSPVL
jgi:hypothetical protein